MSEVRQSAEVFTTGAALYREIRRRGLDLRARTGRDRVLFTDLCRGLHCPDQRLQRFLAQHSEISADQFLRVFLEVTEPFARMYEEIWRYLAAHKAKRASEAIAVQFGRGSGGRSDLEQFRRYSEIKTKITTCLLTHIWPVKALTALADLRPLLDAGISHVSVDWTERSLYVPGRPYRLASLPPGTHPLVARIHALFQQIIDTDAEIERSNSAEDQATGLGLSLKGVKDDEQHAPARLLTNLLPLYEPIFEHATDISPARLLEAEAFFERAILPKLKKAEAQRHAIVRQALDILDLPFWRYRWRTYEIWVAVTVLVTLRDYRPKLLVQNGRTALDGTSGDVAAILHAESGALGCVAVQFRSKQGGYDIQPDLRICLGRDPTATNTAVIVESKQRGALEARHVKEVTIKYTLGAAQAVAVVVVNYDNTGLSTKLPARSALFEGVQPLANSAVEAFRQAVAAAVRQAGFVARSHGIVVLLDVSASMGVSYQTQTVRQALRRLYELPGVQIFRFNYGLLDDSGSPETELVGSGGTELGRALEQLRKKVPRIDRMLLISDGEHDHPATLREIPDFVRRHPEELEVSLGWLLRPLDESHLPAS